MHHVVSNDLSEDYAFILRETRDKGEIVCPRGKYTREMLAFTLELRDPTRALPRHTGRKLSMALAGAEALQLVGGFSDPGQMLQISKHFDQFTDGGVFHAPYGPRIATQLPEALEWLRRDPDTRKAHVAVWNPLVDLWTHDTRDHPCTTHMQFMVRRGALDLHVGMRANDAWRGFPNDVFQFCQLQLAAADYLRYPPGTYYHHVTSFHLYEENAEMVDGLISATQTPLPGVGLDYHFATWAMYQQRAREIFYGIGDSPADGGDDLNPGERRIWDALRKAGVEGAW